MRKVLPILFSILLSGCSRSGNYPASPEASALQGSLRIILRTAALSKNSAGAINPSIDSIAISVSGTDMDNMIQAFKTDELVLEIHGIPPGEGRLVEAGLFDTAGVMIYQGTAANVAILAGAGNQISINCFPVFSEVIATFPLGKDNPLQVAGGVLSLIKGPDTASADLSIIGGEIGRFYLPRIKGGEKYEIQAYLELADGTIIYQNQNSDSIHIPEGESVSFELGMVSKLGKAALELILNPESRVNMSIRTQDAIRRPPGQGEIIFTEFFPQPSSNDKGSDGEWLEIYNRSMDTLLLDGCRIAKSRTATSVTTRHDLDSGTVLLPGGLLVFGRDSVTFSDYPYALSLVGTKQSILFVCEDNGKDVLVDSVSYTSEYPPQDSIASQEGLVSSLVSAKIGEPAAADNWCLTKMAEDATYGAATPGEVLSNCL
ncbi:lamin tail domain-containing protein [Fibrobacterota bacterium]